MLHLAENNDDSQHHLEDNFDKFNGDCKTVLGLLYKGLKLTGRQLERDYDIDSRRLRDLYAARPDIVKRTWVYTPDGKKTKYKQYYVEIPMPPSKQELVNWASEYLETKHLKQSELFK